MQPITEILTVNWEVGRTILAGFVEALPTDSAVHPYDNREEAVNLIIFTVTENLRTYFLLKGQEEHHAVYEDGVEHGLLHFITTNRRPNMYAEELL